jgi:hypothetical protein
LSVATPIDQCLAEIGGGADVGSRSRFCTELVRNLRTYLVQNKASIVKYCRRYWSGQSILCSPAESATNSLVNVRMNKKRQMRWSPIVTHRAFRSGPLLATAASNKPSMPLRLDPPQPFPAPWRVNFADRLVLPRNFGSNDLIGPPSR